MEEINLKELFRILLKKWWILVLCAVICAAAAGLWSYYMLVPMYSANTTLYIGKSADDKATPLTNDLYLGTLLVSDYQELIKSRLVSSQVIEELGLTNYSAGQMAAKIGVSQKNDTRVMQIVVSDSNPKMAMDIANKAAEVFQGKVMEIMKIENVQIIDKAILPQFPVSPNKSRNTAVGFVIGMVIGLGIILLIEFLDDTLKTAEDVKKYLNMPVIGTIPSFQHRGRAI